MSGRKPLSWVKWDRVVSSFEKGGLNIGSLRAMNCALLGKWWWRLLSEENAFWVKVINSIYGRNEGLFGNSLNTPGGGSIWGKIIQLGVKLQEEGINFTGSFRKSVGDGNDTRFWDDRCLESNPNAIMADRGIWVETYGSGSGSGGGNREGEKWENWRSSKGDFESGFRLEGKKTVGNGVLKRKKCSPSEILEIG